MGSCNCPSFEEWYGGVGHRVPAQHLGAILRRINYINLHEFELSSGEVVDLCPVMTNDEKEHFKASGYRVVEVEVDGALQRWPMYQIDIGVDHPNTHKSWAFPTDAMQPANLDVDLDEAGEANEDEANEGEANEDDANEAWFAQDLGVCCCINPKRRAWCYKKHHSTVHHYDRRATVVSCYIQDRRRRRRACFCWSLDFQDARRPLPRH
jgi:hypothetical protein